MDTKRTVQLIDELSKLYPQWDYDPNESWDYNPFKEEEKEEESE